MSLQVEEVIQRCDVQTLHLDYIKENIPKNIAPYKLEESTSASAAKQHEENVSGEADLAASESREAQAAERKKKQQAAPRRYQ